MRRTTRHCYGRTSCALQLQQRISPAVAPYCRRLHRASGAYAYGTMSSRTLCCCGLGRYDMNRSCSCGFAYRGELMKNIEQTVAALIAAAALASAAGAQTVDNWRSAAGDVWKNARRRNAGAMQSGPRLLPPLVATAQSSLPKAAGSCTRPAPAPAPAAASCSSRTAALLQPLLPQLLQRKVTYAADAFF